MNLLKQMVEYSPAGFATLRGAQNKTEQLSKAIMGTASALGASTLLASNRLTWTEPTDQNRKNEWRSAGMQPYSVRIGDKWYSYQKLPPMLAFNLALVAGLDDALKKKSIDENQAQAVLTAFGNIYRFTVDQSYMKSIGDLVAAASGDEDATAKLVSGYPQQLIPYRALSGWVARVIDTVQRRPNPDDPFWNKQLQYLMMQIPGLSKKVPARTDQYGAPLKIQHPYINAINPVRISDIDKEKTNRIFEREKEEAKASEASKEQRKRSNELKEEAKNLYQKFLHLPTKEEQVKFLDLLDNNMYKRVQKLHEDRLGLISEEAKVLKSSRYGVETGTRAEEIWRRVQEKETKEEKIQYMERLEKEGVISETVYKQIQELASQSGSSGL
jgi:hypothetical protein